MHTELKSYTWLVYWRDERRSPSTSCAKAVGMILYYFPLTSRLDCLLVVSVRPAVGTRDHRPSSPCPLYEPSKTIFKRLSFHISHPSCYNYRSTDTRGWGKDESSARNLKKSDELLL